jgi:3-deoxy-manno-octulosonate cytidylyltransferase (CMP-KDO synthetase)
MITIAIIPARMGSTRFPGKPLYKLCGLPMIGHVYKRTIMSDNIDLTYVATCDKEIYDYIISIGGNAVMTSDSHERASDRAAEAVGIIEKNIDKKINFVAMIQGDEPLVAPDDIDRSISILKGDKHINIVNLMSNIDNHDSFQDKNEVKVVTDLHNNALFFSREPIPSNWHSKKRPLMKKQLGLIFFRRDYLESYNLLNPTPLEELESIDMLRVLENGEKIKMELSVYHSIGVDTKNDAKEAEKLLNVDQLFLKYKDEI